MKEGNEVQEASKDTGRMALFTAIGTFVTYFINQIVSNVSPEVSAAILTIVTAGLIWLDSWIHHHKGIKSNGISPI